MKIPTVVLLYLYIRYSHVSNTCILLLWSLPPGQCELMLHITPWGIGQTSLNQTLRICIQVQFSQRYGQIKDRRPKFFLNIFGLAWPWDPRGPGTYSKFVQNPLMIDLWIEECQFSKHQPSGPMLSISRFVRPSVCLSVCLSVCVSVCSLLRYRLTVFLPPLPEVGCPTFLEIRNPGGKVMERSGLRYEHFCLKIV